MPNANWSNPTLTSTYTNFVSEVKNRDEDLALQFDGTTSTNLVTNTIRWDSSANRWKKWNGTSWAELTATYALTALSTTGNASIGGTLGVTGGATLSSTLGVTGAITGSSTVSGTALIPTAATVPTNGLYLPAANSVALATASTGRLFIDSTGKVGIGTSSPVATLNVLGGDSVASIGDVLTKSNTVFTLVNPPIRLGIGYSSADAPYIQAFNNSTVAARALLVNPYGGNVGIGTTTPAEKLDVSGGNIRFGLTGFLGEAGAGPYDIQLGPNPGSTYSIARNLAFYTNQISGVSTERARIDNAGRLLVGTDTSTTLGAAFKIQVEATDATAGYSAIRNGGTAVGAGPNFRFGRSAGTTLGAVTAVADGYNLGNIVWHGSNGTNFSNIAAQITCDVDGAVSGGGANDMPGRLTFGTTADGAATPTERMRISSTGAISTVTTGGSTLYPALSCRAWVNFNGTGTVAIRADENVSSITDNGVGNYTVNLTTAMQDANYSVCANAKTSDTSTADTTIAQWNTLATSSFRLASSQGNNGVLVDSVNMSAAIFR